MTSAQLVPCPECRRHVRLDAIHCPFCSAGLDAQALAQQHTPRRAAGQPGAKRALVFALGAAVAAACNEHAQPVYGAAVAPVTDTGTISNDGATEDTDVPVTSEFTSGATSGAPDTSSAAATHGQGGAGQSSGGDRQSNDTATAIIEPRDAGAGDAGGDSGFNDAAIPDTPTLEPVEPTPIPVYGAPPL